MADLVFERRCDAVQFAFDRFEVLGNPLQRAGVAIDRLTGGG
jgi:hypothetical protein